MINIPDAIYEDEMLSISAKLLIGHLYKDNHITMSWRKLARVICVFNNNTSRNAAESLEVAGYITIRHTGKGASEKHALHLTDKALCIYLADKSTGIPGRLLGVDNGK